MAENKTQPTAVPVADFLATVSPRRQAESAELIAILTEITGCEPVMWGPSIIGFGSRSYQTSSGHSGDTPLLAFSPRTSAITVYISEGFDRYGPELATLGKHKTSVSCLYLNKLPDIDLDVLQAMLRASYKHWTNAPTPATSVSDYLNRVPGAARAAFTELRQHIQHLLPEATEVLRHDMIGYQIGTARPVLYVSAWGDHLSVYPVPKAKHLRTQLAPYHRQGTVWLPLTEPLPTDLIAAVVAALLERA